MIVPIRRGIKSRNVAVACDQGIGVRSTAAPLTSKAIRLHGFPLQVKLRFRSGAEALLLFAE
jgi:hypothetical protein